MSERPHWYPAYVGLGSNLQMPLYRSAPFGGIEQPDFVNAAAALLTQLGPSELLDELQQIEARQGRERDDKRWGPRVLDLDLLVHAAAVIDEPGITIPHPGIGERNFVLLPLLEIAPELVIPGLGRAVAIPVNWDEPSISRIV